jgi:hypothetical protein
METISRIGNSELSITAIKRVTGKARVIAKILSAGPAIRAIAISPTKPWDSHAISDCEGGSGFGFGTLRSLPHVTDFFDMSDNLVTENQRQFRIRQFAVNYVEVSATNTAGADSHEQLSPARLRLWQIAEL